MSLRVAQQWAKNRGKQAGGGEGQRHGRRRGLAA